MPDTTTWLLVIPLVALLALSAFFSMSETAIIRANRFHIHERAGRGEHRARVLDKMLQHPEHIISTILVGNNLVNIAAASLATVIAVGLWGAPGAVYATFGLTAIVLVFSEITPKTLAVRRAESISLWAAIPLRFSEYLLRPVARVLSGVARIILRLFGVKAPIAAAPFVTQEEIESMVKVGAREGEVEKFEAEVISEVFEFTETDVRDVMTPRDDVKYLDKDQSMRTALDLSAQTGHSRLPVVDGDFGHVLGFVHVKDLLAYSDEELESEPVTDVLRGVLFTRDDARSDKVLIRMQREHKLMAIVQDDEGRNIGIATAEDLLEELVGEIHDEFDMEEE